MTLDIENTDFCAYNSTLPVTDVPLADTFEEAIKMLGPDHSFAFFDLGLTAAEKEVLSQLEVTSVKRYTPDFDSNFHDSYMNYLKDIGNDEEISSTASSIVERIVHSTQNSPTTSPFIYGYASSPESINSPFNWHIDQRDDSYESLNYRISVALKGPGTVFCKLAQDEQKQIEARNTENYIHNMISHVQDEQTMIDVLSNAPNPCAIENGHTIHQAPSYFGAVFIIGKTDLSAIHTAPIVDTKRVFLSIAI